MPAMLRRLPSSWHRFHSFRWSAAAALGAVLVAAATLLTLARFHPHAQRAAHALTATQREAQQQCEEGAQLMHDARWAAACEALAERGEGDGYAECELPNREAGRLYSLLDQAEQECRADAVASNH